VTDSATKAGDLRDAAQHILPNLFDPARLPSRRDDGHVWHPDIGLRIFHDGNPDDEAPFSRASLAEVGWELHISEFDADENEVNFDDESAVLRAVIEWDGDPPGADWRLGCIHQDDDGEWCAWWLRRFATQPAAQRKEEW
jgi:hypothetical protein